MIHPRGRERLGDVRMAGAARDRQSDDSAGENEVEDERRRKASAGGGWAARTAASRSLTIHGLNAMALRGSRAAATLKDRIHEGAPGPDARLSAARGPRPR